MLRFFRHLRQRLLTESKFSKYLLYAIGELGLIVLGILIALYLDGLNAEKQEREVETELLTELKSNLQSNMKILQRTLYTEKEYLAYNEMILEYMDQGKPYEPALDDAFGVYFWTVSSNPITGGYEFLKAKGIDLITNDSLRKQISFIFENEFSILKNENELWSNNLQQNISYPYHVKHFRRYYTPDKEGEAERAKPFDYQALQADPEFKSINAEIISNRRWNINSLNRLMEELRNLVSQIERELQEKS